MTNENKELQRQLALFVDGELTAEAENLFLAQCEADPGRYRDVALALVEQRRWQRALAGLQVGVADALPVAKPTATNAGMKSSTWWLGLAASLFLGMAAGSWMISSRNRAAPSPTVATNGVATNAVAANSAAPGLPVVEAGESDHWLDPSARYLPNTPESLVSFVRNLDSQPPFPADTMRELDADGLAVDQDSRVFVIDMPDGRRLAVPAQITNVSRRSR